MGNVVRRVVPPVDEAGGLRGDVEKAVMMMF